MALTAPQPQTFATLQQQGMARPPKQPLPTLYGGMPPTGGATPSAGWAPLNQQPGFGANPGAWANNYGNPGGPVMKSAPTGGGTPASLSPQQVSSQGVPYTAFVGGPSQGSFQRPQTDGRMWAGGTPFFNEMGPAAQAQGPTTGMQPAGPGSIIQRPAGSVPGAPQVAPPTPSAPMPGAPYRPPPSPQPYDVTRGGTNPVPTVNGQPNLSYLWQQQYMNARQGHLAEPRPTSYQPGPYQGTEQIGAPGQQAYAPDAQGRERFAGSAGADQVGGMTQQAIMEMIRNPSRYGGEQAGQAFDVLNRRITQAGEADRQRIDEDMARRGMFNSTTAGGRLGDLATNLNQQRSDVATQIALDQARQFQGDRSSAIAQALGFGGQQFGQDLSRFQTNLGAGQQAFEQQATAAQLRDLFGGNAFGRGLQAGQFNEGLAQNQFNADLARDQFMLGQSGQNWQQALQAFGANQGANQQGFDQRLASIMGLQGAGQQAFNNQMTTAQFNAQQQQQQSDLMLRLLGLM